MCLRVRRFGYSVSFDEVERLLGRIIALGSFWLRMSLAVKLGWRRLLVWRGFSGGWRLLRGLRFHLRSLDLHLRKRSSQSVEERRWALRLALEYSRDNPDLQGKDRAFVKCLLTLTDKQNTLFEWLKLERKG